MAFRVVMIENEVTIKVKLNNLIVNKNGEDIWIPLDDISVIVLDNLASMLSARLLCQLSEQGISLLICNQMHLPTGQYHAFCNHTRAAKVIGYQIEKSKEYYDRMWKEIVKAKIQNQSKAYLKMMCDESGAEQILSYTTEISNGDSTNREAHAAKVYFGLLMGQSFSRGNEDILLNSGLDYGYAIIRSYLARACAGYGLNTQIGIHHKSEYNHFNLIDDLIEPVRPIVDVVAYEIMKEDDFFKVEHRRQLVNILNMKIRYRGKKMFISSMLENYVEQYASLIMGRCIDIVYPDLNDFIGEEKDEL